MSKKFSVECNLGKCTLEINENCNKEQELTAKSLMWFLFLIFCKNNNIQKFRNLINNMRNELKEIFGLKEEESDAASFFI